MSFKLSLKLKNYQNQNLTHLDLSDLDLTSIPKDIQKLQNLKKLTLKDNNISEIPPWLSDLKSLEFIDLSYN